MHAKSRPWLAYCVDPVRVGAAEEREVRGAGASMEKNLTSTLEKLVYADPITITLQVVPTLHILVESRAALASEWTRAHPY